MKKLLFSTVICLCATLFSSGQTKEKVNEHTVQETITDMFQALSDRNIEAIKKYCTNDILILENGAIWNLDTLTQKISQPVAKDFKRINKIDFFNIEIKKKVAWVSYNNQAEITSNGSVVTKQWLETVVLIKERKRWKIKMLHSTIQKKNN